MLSAIRRFDRPGQRRRLLADRYGGNYLPVVLCLLLLIILMAVANPNSDAWTIVLSVLYAILIPLGLLGAGVRSDRVAAGALTALIGAWLLATGTIVNSDAIAGLSGLIFVQLLLLVQIVTLRDVVLQTKVTIDTVLGGVAAYLLMSFLWAYIYLVQQRLDHGSLSGALDTEQPRLGQTLYFSIVTQTTLGYGDIKPVSGLARAFVQLEAITGQLFIAVLVAWIVGRLVSRHGSLVERQETEVTGVDSDQEEPR